MIPESWRKNHEHQKAHQIYLESPAGQAFLAAVTEACIAPIYPASPNVEGLVEASGMRDARLSGQSTIRMMVKMMTFDSIREALDAKRQAEETNRAPRSLKDMHPDTPPTLRHPHSGIS